MNGIDSFITYDGGRLDFLGGQCSLSTGDSLEVKSIYSHDGTGHSQSITRRVRNTALTGSIRWVVDHQDCLEAGVSTFGYVAAVEGLCGKLVTLTFNGQVYSDLLITDAGISIYADSVDIIASASLSLAFTEGYKPKGKTPYTAVRAI